MLYGLKPVQLYVIMKTDKCQTKSVNKYKDVKNYRKQAGLSQQQLAVLLGVRRATISDWENGVYFPTPENIQKMAKIFGADVATLKADIEVTRAINELKRRNISYEKVLTFINMDDLDVILAIKQLQEHKIPKEDLLCMMS
jgi:transcriptional regulator with XRE-family HTH domain